jgi:outer membrane protein assembly factor BamE (lipoprotein component of BamABCDE complex)
MSDSLLHANQTKTIINKPNIKRRIMKKTTLTAIQILALVLTSAWLIGCATSGQQMDRSQVENIQKGVTTRAELEAMLGTPMHAGMMDNGRRLLTFQFHETRVKGESFIPYAGAFIGGRDHRAQILQVILDANGVVEDFEFSDSTIETKQEGFGSRQTTTPTR